MLRLRDWSVLRSAANVSIETRRSEGGGTDYMKTVVVVGRPPQQVQKVFAYANYANAQKGCDPLFDSHVTLQVREGDI